MVTWDITVGGTPLENLFDLNYSQGESNVLGTLTITCANSTTNRSFQSGDEVIAKKNGDIAFTGFVVGKPTKAGADAVELELDVSDKRVQLKYEQVKRVFYQMDTGEIVREAINKRISPVTLDNSELGTFIHQGDELDDWDSNIPEFQLGDIFTQSLYDVGSNFIFCGWPQGSGGNTVYKATFDDVPFRAIPGDGLVDTLQTRVLINDSGQQFSMEINLRDDYGNNYNWYIERPQNRFNLYELKAEEAKPTAEIGNSLNSDGSLEYRFEIDGELPESRAAAIDFATTIPFQLEERDTDIDTSGVGNTGSTITRRVDRSIFEMLQEFGTENGYISYINEDDTLFFEQAGQNIAPQDIEFNTTPVISAKFNRDYDNIVNKVTVQGDDDIRVTVEDTASVRFYGISPREQPLTDTQIQTQQEATQRAKGFLRENAWSDTAFTFEIADESYSKLSIGDDISVSWPPEGINGSYSITEITTDYHGIVTVSLTSSDAT